MFSTPESGKISDRWTCVEIEGGEDLDDAGRAFMKRYDVRGYPSLLAVTAGGALVDRDLSDGRLRTAEFLYQALERADALNARFLERKAELQAAGDIASRLELVDRLVERQELTAADDVLEQVFAEAPTAELGQRRLVLLAQQGEREREKELLDALLARFPDADERMGWRMRRATIHIAPPASPDEGPENTRLNLEALEGLRAELGKEGDAEGEGTTRVTLARLELALGHAEASRAHLDWVFEHAPAERAARVAHLLLASQALQKRDAETVRTHTAAVLELAPKSAEAATAHMMLGDLAYSDHDLDAMEAHFKAVVELAPDSPMAKNARSTLESLARRRARDGD